MLDSVIFYGGCAAVIALVVVAIVTINQQSAKIEALENQLKSLQQELYKAQNRSTSLSLEDGIYEMVEYCLNAKKQVTSVVVKDLAGCVTHVNIFRGKHCQSFEMAFRSGQKHFRKTGGEIEWILL